MNLLVLLCAIMMLGMPVLAQGVFDTSGPKTISTANSAMADEVVSEWAYIPALHLQLGQSKPFMPNMELGNQVVIADELEKRGLPEQDSVTLLFTCNPMWRSAVGGKLIYEGQTIKIYRSSGKGRIERVKDVHWRQQGDTLRYSVALDQLYEDGRDGYYTIYFDSLKWLDPLTGVRKDVDQDYGIGLDLYRKRDPLMELLGPPIMNVHWEGKSPKNNMIVAGTPVVVDFSFVSDYALEHPEECRLSVTGISLGERGCFGLREVMMLQQLDEFVPLVKLPISTDALDIHFGGQYYLGTHDIFRKAADGEIYRLDPIRASYDVEAFRLLIK